MTGEYPIEIKGLRKEYGQFVAVDNLDLSIKKNSFTGLLGPNGAGKSTTLKILTNLISATSGNAYLNGVDIAENPKEALMGVGTVVETPEFYLYLTPRETLRYIGEIIGMSTEAIASETDEILEKVKMTEWADKKMGTFSKGMRQRIALGQALLNDPSVIVLDEPTSGLDPRGMAEVRDILKNLRNETKDLTVLMSSHMLHEVSDLCDRVAIMNHGKLLIHDDIGKVIDKSGVRTIFVKILGEPNKEAIAKISGLPNVANAERYGNDIEVRFKGDVEEQADLFRAVDGLGIKAYSLSEGDNGLESTYLDLIKESR